MAFRLRSLRVDVRLIGKPVKRTTLADAEVQTEGAKKLAPEKIWIHVASEGDYKGYDPPFSLTREIFDQFVTNLRGDARYKAGADGVGESNVIQYDYEHLSETLGGSVASEGAPAAAWVLDLKIEDGDDGKAQLWAWTRLLTKAREQVANQEYQFTSIAFGEGIDPESGESVGMILTSIAFTNHPFLTMLTPIAARGAGGRVVLRGYYGETANSPTEAFEYTRCVLNLPAATSAEEVIGHMSRIVNWVKEPGTATPGVDLDALMGDLRKIWGVPITATADEILAQAGKAQDALVQESQPSAEAPPTGLTGRPPRMSDKLISLLRTILTRSGSNPHLLATEEGVAAAVEETVTAKVDLAKVLESLGVANAAEALKSVPSLIDARAKLQTALSDLDAAMAANQAADEAMATADVDAAVAARKFDKSVVTALRARRSQMITDEEKRLTASLPAGTTLSFQHRQAARATARTAFLTEYGVASDRQSYLLTNHVAGPNDRQLAPTSVPHVPAPDGRGLRLSSSDPASGDQVVIDLRAEDGANTTVKLHNFIRRTEKITDFRQIDRRAHELRRSPAHQIVT